MHLRQVYICSYVPLGFVQHKQEWGLSVCASVPPSS